MSKENFNYKKYVTDESTLKKYNEYQNKYKSKIRDSDQKIIDILKRFVGTNDAPSILDMGCSTGNLLYHIKKSFPNSILEGGDLSQSSIDLCKSDEDLRGISFNITDLLEINKYDKYDFIIVNAVTYLLSSGEFEKALKSIHNALKSKGKIIDFDFFHPFDIQDLEIYETNEWHPTNAMKLHFRPYKKVKEALESIGYGNVQFEPFIINTELPFLGFDKDTTSYTKKDYNGQNMLFRGILYQPWCHMIAEKQ